MIFQKTTFERVFPAAHYSHRLTTYTDFGFESAGKRYFIVTVPGKPRIEQGMTVIALLNKPNGFGTASLNGGSPLGWIDCDNGALVYDTPIKHFGECLLLISWTFIIPARAYSLFGTEDPYFLIVAITSLFCCTAVRVFFRGIEAILIKRALKEVRNLYNPVGGLTNNAN